ncbi:MAG: type II toxin-antitoxin system death-on-curing family toxin [Candidatus Saccharibacteria bacterium]
MFGGDPEEDLRILCYIHDAIIDESGGSKGFHNEHLVRSALARPNHSAFGKDAYTDLFTKAAALLDSIANNHGFRDGNKRYCDGGGRIVFTLA